MLPGYLIVPYSAVPLPPAGFVSRTKGCDRLELPWVDDFWRAQVSVSAAGLQLQLRSQLSGISAAALAPAGCGQRIRHSGSPAETAARSCTLGSHQERTAGP